VYRSAGGSSAAMKSENSDSSPALRVGVVIVLPSARECNDDLLRADVGVTGD
jgi:hypothetical protein